VLSAGLPQSVVVVSVTVRSWSGVPGASLSAGTLSVVSGSESVAAGLFSGEPWSSVPVPDSWWSTD